jgi:hypothetical protein
MLAEEKDEQVPQYVQTDRLLLQDSFLFPAITDSFEKSFFGGRQLRPRYSIAAALHLHRTPMQLTVSSK